MNALGVWMFDDPDGAATALRVIERLQTRRRLAIADAAVVSWPAGKHRPYSYQAGTIDGTAALSGAFWGWLFASLFLVPLIDPATSPAGLTAAGLPDDLLRQLRSMVTPGSSALFVLAGAAAVDTIGDDGAVSGGTRLITPLGAGPEQVLRHVFGADDAYPDWSE